MEHSLFMFVFNTAQSLQLFFTTGHFRNGLVFIAMVLGTCRS
jgi:hypothetical protein